MKDAQTELSAGPWADPNAPQAGYRGWAVGCAMLVMFTTSLSTTNMATAAPTVAADIGGFHLYGWIFAGYALCATVAMPVVGSLSDSFGRRPFYFWMLALFALGSVLAGAAPSMWWLIAARGLMGFGGGALLSLATITVADAFTRRERAKWMGLALSSVGVGNIVGPITGGVITDAVGWRWIFFAPLPLLMIAWALVYVALPSVRHRRTVPVDFAGSALLILGLSSLLLAFTWGGRSVPWVGWKMAGLLATAGVFVAGFAWVEQRATKPLMSPDYFRHPVFLSAIVVTLLAVAYVQAATAFIPLFAEGVMGRGATNAGILLFPLMASFVVGSTIAGQVVARIGRFKPVAVAGTALLCVGALLLTQLSVTSDNAALVAAMIPLGLGWGASTPVLALAVQVAFQQHQLGSVNSARQVFASLGPAMSLPIASSVLAARFDQELTKSISTDSRQLLIKARVDPQRLVTPEAQREVRRLLEELPGGDVLYGRITEAVRASLSTSLTHVFVLLSGLALLALLVVIVSPDGELDGVEPLATEAHALVLDPQPRLK